MPLQNSLINPEFRTPTQRKWKVTDIWQKSSYSDVSGGTRTIAEVKRLGYGVRMRQKHVSKYTKRFLFLITKKIKTGGASTAERKRLNNFLKWWGG